MHEATVEKTASMFRPATVNLFDLDDQETFRKEVADSDIFTNATRVGMKPMDDQSIITDTSLFRKDLVVSDVVYNPRETKLLKDAAAAGCKTIPESACCSGRVRRPLGFTPVRRCRHRK